MGHVFLSYVRENKDLVDRLKTDLKTRRIVTWIDRDSLHPGQLWEEEIRAAIKSASFFIACFSAESEGRRRTQMNEEILTAIEELGRRPDSDFFIPIRFSECRIRDYPIGGNRTLSSIQRLDLFSDWQAGVNALALKLRQRPAARQFHTSKGAFRATQAAGDKLRTPTRYSHMPGGPVPVIASHYVPREHDALITESVTKPPFTMLVDGPVQAGKSTVLALLQRKAFDAGMETAWFDPQSQTTAAGAVDEAAAEADAARMMAELVEDRWRLNAPKRGPIRTIAQLINWMTAELAREPAKPRLLILDDLVTLGPAGLERWLPQFVRGLSNLRATRDVNVSIAVGLSMHFDIHLRRKLIVISSSIHWHPQIPVGWFTQREVSEMTLKLNVGENLTLPNIAFDAFKGQPYLTHAALVDRDFLETASRWAVNRSRTDADAVRQSRWYIRHLAAVRLVISGPAYDPGPDAKALIRSFASACESAAHILDRQHGQILEKLQLLARDGQPTLEIYRLLAEDMLEKDGTP